MQHTGSSAAVAEAPGPEPSARRRPVTTLVSIAVAAVVSALIFLVVHRSLIDDAYITLSYARNLAEHFHWGLTEYRTANSATSPLNVVLLALGAFILRDPIWGLGLVFVVLNVLQVWGLTRLAAHLRLARGTGLLAWLVVALSPLMLAIVGMEMTLAVTLVVWLALAAVTHRAVAFGLLTAALLLTRVDLLVFPVVLLLATRGLWRRAPVAIGTAVLAALPWYLFSWLALGAFVPDTLVIKTGENVSWGPWSFWNGPLLYLRTYEAATAITLIPAAIGGLVLLAWFATLAWRRPGWSGTGTIAAVGVAGVLHYAAYWLLAPPPFHWYYAPSATAVMLAGVLLLGRAAALWSTPADGAAASPRPRVVTAVAAVAALALVATDVGFVLSRPLPWVQAPISTNWATAEQYQRIGEDLQEAARGEVVASPGEIGTLAYYCECDIVDVFSDRGAIVPLVARREREASPVMRALLELNFSRLDRDQDPAEPTLGVAYEPGPPTSDEGWPVDSTWLGPGRFFLEELVDGEPV